MGCFNPMGIIISMLNNNKRSSMGNFWNGCNVYTFGRIWDDAGFKMICIIPARGGSERFPGKNIAPLFGQPIINHTIDICQRSGLFTDIVVSTDDQDIADKISDKNVSIHIRPDYLKGDSDESKVIECVMDFYGVTRACRVYPFACLLTPERLQTGYARVVLRSPDAVMECTEYDHPPQRAIDCNGHYCNPDLVMQRTQDLDLRMHDAGTFMFTTREALDKPLGERYIEWIPVPRIDVQDVDTAEDFEMLKLKFMRRML